MIAFATCIAGVNGPLICATEGLAGFYAFALRMEVQSRASGAGSFVGVVSARMARTRIRSCAFVRRILAPRNETHS